MALAGMGFVLQNAKGDLGLHIKGNILSLLLLIPSLIVSTLHFGAVGAAISWTAINLFSLLFWTSVIHRKFLPELTTRWLFVDIAPAICVATLVVVSAQFTVWPFPGRTTSLVALVTLTAGIIATVLMIQHATRKLVYEHVLKIVNSLCKPNH